MIFVISFPYLGVFVYLIARGHKMGEHAGRRRRPRMRRTPYIQAAPAPAGARPTRSCGWPT